MMIIFNVKAYKYRVHNKLIYLTPSPLQCANQAYVFSGDSGACAAFLVNIDNTKSVLVQFQNSSYELPRQSISILPDCKTVSFNTAKVNSDILKKLLSVLRMVNFFKSPPKGLH